MDITVVDVNEADLSHLILSPGIIDFFACHFDGLGFGVQHWPDQISEKMQPKRRFDIKRAEWQLARLISHNIIQGVGAQISRIASDLRDKTNFVLPEFHEQYRLTSIVGMPRTGGSYLTAEWLRALGYDPLMVPAIIAHDGFPDVGTDNSSPKPRSRKLRERSSQDALAEYMVAASLFFNKEWSGKIHIVKKFPKAVNNWRMIDGAFGEDRETIITVRDPINCIVSAYEKAGGLPNGHFRVRSTIERWALQSALSAGAIRNDIFQRDYFDVMLEYWTRYYTNVATSGVLNGWVTVCPYSAESMYRCAEAAHLRFASGLTPCAFFDSGSRAELHPSWVNSATLAINSVEKVWSDRGFKFPARELRASMIP